MENIAHLSIVFSDSALLVINKPAGLLSLPDGYDPSKPHLRSILEEDFGRLWIVHRLDRETSGVMVLARNEDAHRDLNGQFSERQVSKVYHAIVSGNPDWDEKDVVLPLRSDVGRRRRSVVDRENGKESTTHFRVLERFEDSALVEAQPKTGRRHQIRAHLYNLDNPALSDPLYGPGERSPLISRLALHAFSLAIRHPRTGERVVFEAQYPSEFVSILQELRK
ncbi:MAG: RluA family pseudouridine synthase [Anaerolineales bacterium]|nr:RluA family pseudouridine synthase [Anaerolineales bacterium]